jgi:hypothetical protein
LTEETVNFCAALFSTSQTFHTGEAMPKHTRRFGAYHRASQFNQPPLGRMFSPLEIDALLHESLVSDKSLVSSDKLGVSDKSEVRGDKSGESAGNSEHRKEMFSTDVCGKVCGKPASRRYKFLKILDF